ncbi:hypothetical protein FI667_g12556, partial [Globisporangium splendens]
MRARGDGRTAFSPRVRHGASLSALYLTRPQRLVGCSLPPQALRSTTSEGNVTKGFLTLAIPHILESTASTQMLPATSLVRFRWKHEENQRGSLFQPAKIANGGQGTRALDHTDGYDAEEEPSEETEPKARHRSSPRSIEMVYPITADAERFVEYLRGMRELVFDVIDRDTRRIYGKCTVPIFVTSSTFGSNPHGSQQTTLVEHLLGQVKRENALYEIKSVLPDDQNNMIGYLAVNLDVQFKPRGLHADANKEEEKLNRVLYQRSQGSEPSHSVLVPRSRPTVHVNVHRQVDSRELEHDGHAISFDRASAISYLESDALHSLPDSYLHNDGAFSPLGAWFTPNERRSRPRDDSPRHVMLRDLIEKGKALQQSMANATHEDNSFEQLPDESVTVSNAPENGIHHYLDLAAYQQLAESGDEGDWNDPRTMQQLELRSPQNAAENAHSPQLPSATGLEITFESLEFENEFVNQLQQLRNSTISSRFSPIELMVSCNDALSNLMSNDNNSADAPKTSSSLFSIATPFRKRIVRLNYSHVVQFRPPVERIATQWSSVSAKKQFEFYIRCQTQGTPRRTPRRNHQGSRNGQKDFVLLRGVIPVRDVFQTISSGKDHWVEIVQLYIHDESITRNQNAKPVVPRARKKKLQGVGEMQIRFQVSSLHDMENSESGMKGTSDMVFDSVPRLSESVDQTSPALRQPVVEREFESENTHRGPGIKRRKMRRPYRKIVVQLAVMIESVTSIRLPETRTRRGTSSPVDVTVRVEYAIPPICYVENSLVRVNSVKRTIRRKLAQTRFPSIVASIHRVSISHVGVFPLELSRKRVQKFKKQLLIMEVWIQESDARSADDQLLGLVKVPLDAFSSFLIDVNDGWENAEPTVGVDERLPIVDPFSGRTSGYLHTRVAIGTAEQRTAPEIPASNESVREHEAWSDAARPKDQTENVTFLHQIRVEIRDCWPGPRVSGVKKQLKSDEAASVLGCEVQGELRIHSDVSFHPRESKTVQFALWWDASNRQLNSHFVHSIQSTETGPRADIDKAEFTFLVENDFVRSTFAESVTGKATLDLRRFFANEDNDEAIPGNLSYICHDVDVPIKWQQQENKREKLCSSFPLRISYQVSANPLTNATKLQVNELLDTSRVLADDTQNYPSSMITTAVSTTRRLLPATIVVSTAIASITDLKHAIEERWSQVCAIPSERHLKKHLETVLERKSASIIFECNACVGVEVEEADENGDGFLLFKKDGKWYKKIRLPAARIEVSNSQQTLSPLFHLLRISVIVHPEALQSLQQECLVVKILSWSEEQNVEFELGVVSIPVAAVLFRPSGVQGAFPIQIGEALNGRLGVQVFIDHNHEDRNNVTHGGVLQHDADKPDPELSDFRLVSPTSPGEAANHFSPNASQPKYSIQVTAEDFRNVQYLGSFDSSERFHSDAVSSMLQGSHEIEQSIDCLPSLRVGNNSDHDRVSDVTIEMESLGRRDEAVSINPNDTSTDDKTNSQHVASVESFVAQTPAPATLQGDKTVATNEEQSPTVDTASAFYQPITLSSFGIDGLQFSPIGGEESPSPPEAVDKELGSSVISTDNDESSGTAMQPEEPRAALESGNSFSADHSPFSLHLHESPTSLTEISLPLSISLLSDGEPESFSTERGDPQIVVETDVSAASEELHADQSQGEDQALLNASYFSLDGRNNPRDETCTPRAEVCEFTEYGSGEVFPAEDQSLVHVSTVESYNPGHLTVTSREEVDESASVVDNEEFSAEVNGMDQSLVANSDASVENPDDSESEEHRDPPSEDSVSDVDNEGEQSGDGEDETNSELLEESDSMGMAARQECEQCGKSIQIDADVISAGTNLDGEALPEAKIDSSTLVTPDLHCSGSVNAASDLGDPSSLKSGAAQDQQMGDILSRKVTVDVACGTSDDLVSYDEDFGSTDQHQVGSKHASKTLAVDEEVTTVDVACGTSDDLDSYDDDIAVTDKKEVVTEETLSILAADGEDAATKRDQESSSHFATLHVERNAASPNQKDLSPAIEPHGAGTAPISGDWPVQEDSPKQALLSLSADKFDLICQLLSEIRDSCGSRVVKDLLEAPFPERRLHIDLPHEIEPRVAVRENENVMVSPKSQRVSPRRVPASLFADNDEQVGSALHVSAVTKSFNRSHLRKYSVSEGFARSGWSDSSTLQQEIKRRMERSIAGSEDFQSSRVRSDTMMQLSGVSDRADFQHIQYSRAEQLSGVSSLRVSQIGRSGGLLAGYNDADAPAVRGLRSRQSVNKRLLSYKADSETERIARIMQGSVNHWRKGDETLDDSDGESFDSDDDDDRFF